MEFVTKDRIAALSRINRFNGWTSRPYSVLEHTVLGAAAMKRAGKPHDVIRTFLLHDMHETEYGDEVRPVRRDHPNPSKQDAMHQFDVEIHRQSGLHEQLIMCNAVANMDNLMLSVELNHPTLVTRTTDREYPHIEHSQRARIITDLDSEMYRGDLAVEAWWTLWG